MNETVAATQTDAERNPAVTSDAPEAKSAAEPPKKRGGGGLVAGLAFLAGVVALTVSGQIHQQQRDIQQQQQDLESQLAAIPAERAKALAALPADPRLEQLQQQNQQLAQQYQQRIDALQQHLESLAADQQQQQGLNHQIEKGDWVLAEVEYLLRIAHYRLQLLRDTNTAIAALNSADQRLQQMGNANTLPIRSAITDEIQQLKLVSKVDIEGIALRLSQLAKRVEILSPAPSVADSQPASQTSAVSHGTDNSLWQSLEKFVVIRRDGRTINPLPDNAQQLALDEELVALLGRTRISLLSGDAEAFRQQIERSLQFLQDNYDPHHESSRHYLAELKQLREIDLSPPLPDISRSLNLLLQLRNSSQTPPVREGSQP